MTRLGPPPQTFGERLSALVAGMVDRLTPQPESAPQKVQKEVYMRDKQEFFRAFYTALAHAGFEVRKAVSPDDRADIFFKGQNIAFFTRKDLVKQNPFVQVPEQLISTINDIARSTALRCGICSEPPCAPEQIEDLEKRRVVTINEHNGVLLTCAKHPLFDFVLCTYQKDPASKDRIQPQYFYNRDAAFENFAARSGLVDSRKLFTELELKVLYSGLIKLGLQDQNLGEDELVAAKRLVERIEEVIPELKARPQEFNYDREFGDEDHEEERG